MLAISLMSMGANKRPSFVSWEEKLRSATARYRNLALTIRRRAAEIVATQSACNGSKKRHADDTVHRLLKANARKGAANGKVSSLSRVASQKVGVCLCSDSRLRPRLFEREKSSDREAWGDDTGR